MTATVHQLRPGVSLEDIRAVVAEEMISQRLLAPRDVPRPPPVDDEAELALIALAEIGHIAEVDFGLWGRSLHALIFLAIREAYRLGLEPTVERVMTVLRDDGYSLSIYPWVESAMLGPITMTAGVALRRMERAARRRQMLTQVTTLDALLRCPGSDSRPILEAVHELARLADG